MFATSVALDVAGSHQILDTGIDDGYGVGGHLQHVAPPKLQANMAVYKFLQLHRAPHPNSGPVG